MTKPHGVAVGYDGSDFAMQALDWAMDEAELRRLPLTVAHAWQWPYGSAASGAKEHLRKAAWHVLEHGVRRVRESSSIGEVRAELREGPAAELLIELSGRAELVVVGSRGLGRVATTLLGSVAVQVAGEADCPVVVVRGPGPLPGGAHRGPVVLALGEEPHDEQFAFAFGEAELRQVPLLVVHARTPALMAWGPAMAPVPDVEATVRAGERAMAERLAPWREAHAGVRVETRFSACPPVEAVRSAAGTASLLVVGHGPGRLGGVPKAALRHAPCPVAVVGKAPIMAAGGRPDTRTRI
ncbi:universal stress protein [Spongiactinospora rosea]|uniref:Universal stress protein n=1 Tax=Spongiactinospora rosea TaxID=2248750 RepID=A0A366LPK6_9ACTN|nr:universal stress protein [Spongiactinospora rosea]RBQ15831.1 universal stress protein [Spongiactinospora rosea]